MLTHTTPCTREDLAALDLVRTPVWVLDLESGGRWWDNLAALKLWNAASREELMARDIVTTISEASRTRLATLRERVKGGETLIERWSFYPDGAEPFLAECYFSGLLIADQRGDPGRAGMLVEARPIRPEALNPAERRGAEALRYLGELVSYYGSSGEMLMRNPAAVRALGDPPPSERMDHFLASFADPAQAVAARARLDDGGIYRADVVVRTAGGEHWYDTEARRSLDPVTGKLGTLVTQRDIGERRANEAELETSRRQLAAQAEELRRLAAPVIQVADGVLALPLIGNLDRERVEVALAALLPRITADRASRVILDLTGAAVVDEAAADGLRHIARVLQLLGVAPVLTGIRPDLARTMAQAGLDLTGVPFFQSVAQALQAHARAPRTPSRTPSR